MRRQFSQRGDVTLPGQSQILPTIAASPRFATAIRIPSKVTFPMGTEVAG